jgi:nucleoid DNA-binding protein
MNKAQLVEIVAQKTNTKKEAQEMVEMILNAIKGSLKKKEQVALAGFGIFKIKERKARTGRNPKTGETIKIPAKTGVGFKPSKDFKESL